MQDVNEILSRLQLYGSKTLLGSPAAVLRLNNAGFLGATFVFSVAPWWFGLQLESTTECTVEH